MTAIAWAIVFIGLATLNAMYEKALSAEANKRLGWAIVFCWYALFLCTLREWMR